jgi:hypothetical protein
MSVEIIISTLLLLLVVTICLNLIGNNIFSFFANAVKRGWLMVAKDLGVDFGSISRSKNKERSIMFLALKTKNAARSTGDGTAKNTSR